MKKLSKYIVIQLQQASIWFQLVNLCILTREKYTELLKVFYEIRTSNLKLLKHTTRVGQKFCNILVIISLSRYFTWPK